MFEKQTKWLTSDACSKTLDMMLTVIIATENQPLTIFGKKGFQRFMAAAEPRDTRKSEKFLLTSIHSRIVEKVKVLLKPDKADYNLAFSTDCWSGAAEGFMSLTCHFIDY